VDPVTRIPVSLSRGVYWGLWLTALMEDSSQKRQDFMCDGVRLLKNKWMARGEIGDPNVSRYHLSEHGDGRDALTYTNDALKFFSDNRQLAQQVTLRNGEAGLQIRAGSAGGYFNLSGRVVTFWGP